jgi:hypothetical protein
VSAGAGGHGLLWRVRRALALALLPASILPVLLLGPGIARAPLELVHRTVAAIESLERGSR